MLPFAFLTSLLIGVDVACGQTVVGKEECSLANHIKNNTRWRYVHYKDPSGNEINEAPLPLVSPYTSKSEEEINKQINRELFAHYTYLSMAMHFDRDDINLPGFHKFFKESAEEEMKHAQKLMKYQNMRGGRVKLHHIMTPCKDHWGSGLDAMKDALALEKDVYQSLLDLHNESQSANDPQLQDFLESEYLQEQVESIKELSNFVNTLKRLSKDNYALGEYQFDKVTLKGDSKE